MRAFYLFQVVSIVGAQSIHKCKDDVQAAAQGFGHFITQDCKGERQAEGDANDDRYECQVLFPQTEHEKINRSEENSDEVYIDQHALAGR